MAGSDALIEFTAKIMRKFSQKQRDSYAVVQAEREFDTLPTLTAKGFQRPGGGGITGAEKPVEFSASSQQVAGLWPFCVGSSAPLVGTILGRNLRNSQIVCGDPISYYLNGIISAPSCILLGLNGRGKSSLVVRMMMGIIDAGFKTMVLADTKPDYAGSTEAVGGQVIRVGPRLDGINPLDAGPLWERFIELQQVDAEANTDYADELSAEIHNRRVSTIQALFRLSGDKTAREIADDSLLLSIGILEAARRCERMDPPRQPLIADVKEVIQEGTQEMRTALLAENDAEYRAVSKVLVKALNVFGSNGIFGDVFARPTSTPIDLSRSCCFDISAVRASGNRNLLAAVQVVCWSYGQAAISAAKTLAAAGLMEESHYCVILDEMWQVLGVDPEMIRFVNELTRLNRTIGVGQILITHTPKDFVFQDDELTLIAKGFLERSPMKFYGALAESDMEALDQVMPMMDKEKMQLVAWAPDGVMDPETRVVTPPVGLGKFLMKAGKGPGIPFQVSLTEREKAIHDTNTAWASAMTRTRSGRV